MTPTRAARSSSAQAPTVAVAATASQGRGQWIGPDLSTIGVKYGRDELIRSILSPSAAIGYSFRSLVVALADGRVDHRPAGRRDGRPPGPQDRRRRAGRDRSQVDRRPQNQRRLAHARGTGANHDRSRARRPARLPDHAQAAGEHRRHSTRRSARSMSLAAGRSLSRFRGSIRTRRRPTAAASRCRGGG